MSRALRSTGAPRSTRVTRAPPSTSTSAANSPAGPHPTTTTCGASPSTFGGALRHTNPRRSTSRRSVGSSSSSMPRTRRACLVLPPPSRTFLASTSTTYTNLARPPRASKDFLATRTSSACSASSGMRSVRAVACSSALLGVLPSFPGSSAASTTTCNTRHAFPRSAIAIAVAIAIAMVGKGTCRNTSTSWGRIPSKGKRVPNWKEKRLERKGGGGGIRKGGKTEEGKRMEPKPEQVDHR
eukprot:scaffold625_cov324-Pavlova_lutheri.AAC.145